MKRRENRMKDMQTQTEEEIKVRFRLYLRYLYIFSILSCAGSPRGLCLHARVADGEEGCRGCIEMTKLCRLCCVTCINLDEFVNLTN